MAKTYVPHPGVPETPGTEAVTLCGLTHKKHPSPKPVPSLAVEDSGWLQVIGGPYPSH